METRKFVLSQALTLLIGELLVSAVMVAVFVLLGRYDHTVLLGAAVGSVIATANHLLLTIGVVAASAKAEKQDVKGGQALIQLSYTGRLLGLFLVLVLCARSGLFHLLALALPLLFSRPILTITDHFQKKKGGEAV